jgi:hypothetical protein
LALYRLLKGVDQGLAILMVILGSLMVTPLFFVNALTDAGALTFATGVDFLAVFDKPVMLAALGHTYAVAGKGSEARRVLKELEKLATQKHVSSYEIAVIHVGLNRSRSGLRLALQGVRRTIRVAPLFGNGSAT